MTSSSPGPAPGMKICPYCAEEIREAAVKCRFCHSYLTGSLSETDGPASSPVEDAPAEQPARPANTSGNTSGKSSGKTWGKISGTAVADDVAPPPAAKPKPKAKSGKALSRGRQPAGTTRFPALARPAVGLVLAVVVVLLLAANAFMLLSWHGYQQQADARSSAQVEAVNDIEKILSYDYRTLDKTTADSAKLMTPHFKKKYGDTADRVRADAPRLKAVVKAQVVASSVVSAQQDKVKALLFVNQTTTRNDQPQPRVDLNRVEVTLVKDGNDWLVDNIQAL